MSMPVYTIRCNNCDYCASSMLMWGHGVYVDEHGEFPCKKQYGWCDACNEIVAIEDFDDVSSQIDNIRMQSAWLKENNNSYWHKIASLVLPSWRARTNEYLDAIDANLRSIALADKRKNSERCLKCGTKAMTPIYVKDRPDLSSARLEFTDEPGSNSPFFHPVCGGTFYFKQEDIRFNVRSRKRVYSPDGGFLQEIIK